MNARSRKPSRPTRSSREEQFLLDPVDDLIGSGTVLKISEDKWPLSARAPRISLHHAQIRTNIRGKIDLVNHQQPRADDSGTALARDLVALGHVDHIDRSVDQFGAERRGEIVAAAFDDQEIQVREAVGE